MIIEIFCTSTNAENAATKDAYRRMFETELQDDLREHTAFRSSPIFELLVSSERNEETQIDKEKINKVTFACDCLVVAKNDLRSAPSVSETQERTV